MELSKEQQLAFDKYKNNNNIFISGPGGSGKTALIKKIYEHAVLYKKNIQVCALTGCAAILLNCKAKTLHSWAGIGLGQGSFEDNLNKIMNNQFKRKMWKNIDILVVDEVSMLSLKLFNMLNKIGMSVRKNKEPFGGIQVIFSGDFYQLPPIPNKNEDISVQFCFESDEWKKTFDIDNHINLVKIFRQSDEAFSNILNEIRTGKIKSSTNKLLLNHVGRKIEPNLIAKPIKLYPLRSNVDYINNYEMNLLDVEAKDYELEYIDNMAGLSEKDKKIRAKFSENEVKFELDQIMANLNCDKIVTLKVGAQVMCTVNKEIAPNIILCNGSQGIVTNLNKFGLPTVKFNNGHEIVMSQHIWLSETIPGVGVAQIPLMLAWALTIHKSQGATLDAAEIDIGSNIFECGQTYVALSRVKSLNGLYLDSFDYRRIKVNGKVREFYKNIQGFI
jgi:ATP-dependent DNA helicase PIF1